MLIIGICAFVAIIFGAGYFFGAATKLDKGYSGVTPKWNCLCGANFYHDDAFARHIANNCPLSHTI